VISDDELRQILLEDAEDAPDTSAAELLTGARHKWRVRRRLKIAGIATAVAAILTTALAVAPQVADTSSPEPVEPLRPQLEFPGKVDTGDYPVIKSHVNAPGESAFDWTVAVDLDWDRDYDPQPYAFCRIPTDANRTQDKIVAVLAFNRHRVVTLECSSLDGAESNRPRACEIHNVGPPGWLGMYDNAPRQPFTASMWLQRGSDVVDVTGAQFGVAFAVQPAGTVIARIGGYPRYGWSGPQVEATC